MQTCTLVSSFGPRSTSIILPIAPSPAPLQAQHDGPGRPWIALQALAAVPLKAPLSAGYRITRSVSALQRARPERWSRGDLMRVRVEVEAVGDINLDGQPDLLLRLAQGRCCRIMIFWIALSTRKCNLS